MFYLVQSCVMQQSGGLCVCDYCCGKSLEQEIVLSVFEVRVRLCR